MSYQQPLARHWTRIAKDTLVGRAIVGVRYASRAETEGLGWSRRAPLVMLDDGNFVWAAADDEGNDAGALCTTRDEAPKLPALALPAAGRTGGAP